MRRSLLLLLVLYLEPNLSHEKDRNRLDISVVAAMQPECPLSVSGIEILPHNKAYGATVYNSAKVKVTEYEIHWIAAVPPGCSSKGQSHRSSLSRTVHAAVAPESSVTNPAARVQTSELEKIARRVASERLHVQVGVARIRFENGSSWEAESDEEIFTPSLLQESEKCKDVE
jgi:hypothetical protein